jgi:hypothetical protein
MAASMPRTTRAVGDERVPLFGTWPRIYAAVIVSALVVMALVAVFSSFPY